MSYETLSLPGFINEMKDVSDGSHTRRFCFVLGAGASISSGIKSSKELIDIWDDELNTRDPEGYPRWKEEIGIKKEEDKYSHYSQYYDRRYKKEPGDGYNFLEKQMKDANPSVGYVMLAHLLTKTQHNVVITTNFDHLIEDAVNYYSQEIPLVIGHEALAPYYIQRKTTQPVIGKIHRDLLLGPMNQTKELEALDGNWKKYLAIIFSEYHPVFIGYAGNDKSLMDFLNDNSIKFKEGTWKYPYWMLYKDDSLKGDVRKFLDEADGYVINHDGFDETLCRIGMEFNYMMPEEEDFLADAKKRYQALSNAFAKIIDEYSKDAEASGDGGSPDVDKVSNINRTIRQFRVQAELFHMYMEAVMLHDDGKYEEALSIKQKLVEMSSDNARYWDSLGITLHELRRFDEALAAKQKAVSLKPDNARYQNSLGVTLHELKRFDKALAAEQNAVDLESDNARYWDSLGATLHELKHFDEALVAKLKAVDLEPDDARYLQALGVTLRELKRFDEALTAIQKAVDLEPDNAFYWDSLSITLREMGRIDEALAAEQKARDLRKEKPDSSTV